MSWGVTARRMSFKSPPQRRCHNLTQKAGHLTHTALFPWSTVLLYCQSYYILFELDLLRWSLGSDQNDIGDTDTRQQMEMKGEGLNKHYITQWNKFPIKPLPQWTKLTVLGGACPWTLTNLYIHFLSSGRRLSLCMTRSLHLLLALVTCPAPRSSPLNPLAALQHSSKGR